MNLLLMKNNFNFLKIRQNKILNLKNIGITFNCSKLFCTASNSNTTSNSSTTPDKGPNQKKKIEIDLDKKKIFNKKTHYRNYFIDKKLDPPKSLEEQDERELVNWHKGLRFDKKYTRIQDDWQKNLVEKKRKKAITKLNFENYVSIKLI
jgi:hypothetical protein